MKTKTRGCLWIPAAAALLQFFAQPLGAQEPASPAPLFAITGHRETVRFVRYLPPDGRNVFSLAYRSAVVWDAMTGEEVVRLIDGERVYTSSTSPTGARVYVETLAYSRIVDAATGETVLEFDQDERRRLRGPVWSPLGNRIASQERGAVHIWDASSGELLRSFEGLSPTAYSYGVRWSPDAARLAVIQSDGALKVWRVEDGEELAAFQANEPVPGSGAGHMQWSADGSRLVTAANDSMVKIWDTEEWRLLHALENEGHIQFGSGSAIDIVALSPDGRRLAVAQVSSLRVWDAESGDLLVHWSSDPENDDFIPHYGGIIAIAFSPEGRYLASGGLDHTAKIWDIETKSQILNLDFLNNVETAAWSPDGSRAAFGGGGRVVVWDRAAGRETARFEGHRNGAVSALDYAPDGSRIVTAGTDGSVRVWDAETGAQLYELPEGRAPGSRPGPPRRPVEQVSHSPRGGRFLTVSDFQSSRVGELWDHAAQGGYGIMLGFNINSAAWSPDGRRLAAASSSLVTVWDLDNLESTPLLFDPDLEAEDRGYLQAAWSRDGARLLIASNHAATVLDWASGEVLYAPATLERGAAYVEESSDGALLLTVDGQFSGPKVQVWDAETGVELAAIETAGSRVGARFFPDGKRVVTYGGRTPALHVWDALTGEQLPTLEGRRAPFAQAAFSPDGLRLAGASRDGTTWMWDAASGDLLAVFPDGGSGLAFSPDGTRIAGFGAVGAKVWSAGPHFTSESVVHAASFAAGPVAPGQIVSIFGAGLGPAAPVRGAVDPETGRIPSALGGVSVLLDEEPAPLLYVQESQINAQVPYELAGRSSAQLAVAYGGVGGPRAALAVSPARPALFLIPGSMSALVLNENGRLNGAAQPARPGETVMLFGSGQGETSPPGVTGQPASAMDAQRIEDVSVTIGGSAAEVVSAGLAPGFAGVFQIEVRIPAAAASGERTPVAVVIRGEAAPAGAVMSVASP